MKDMKSLTTKVYAYSERASIHETAYAATNLLKYTSTYYEISCKEALYLKKKVGKNPIITSIIIGKSMNHLIRFVHSVYREWTIQAIDDVSKEIITRSIRSCFFCGSRRTLVRIPCTGLKLLLFFVPKMPDQV